LFLSEMQSISIARTWIVDRIGCGAKSGKKLSLGRDKEDVSGSIQGH
jgi:hypothetical protein